MKKIFKLCLTILARVLPLWQLSFFKSDGMAAIN